MTQILKLGTRRSLLAMAQSRSVAREIERRHPGVRVELVGIETRGDRQLDVPLAEVTGKEFFVAELDAALRDGEVDLTVHSMKDLSLKRPADLHLAAIPARENPRDVILFAPDIDTRLRTDRPLRIGTSSPRRAENLAPFLARALPGSNETGRPPRVETGPIRGNVDTRLGFLRLPDAAPKRIDAVVLALAGLNRLWADVDGRATLQHLLPGLRWMLLPLDWFPTAPAQGALAVECREADHDTIALLEPLHCRSTASRVQAERALLAAEGGGCHQAFGATCVHVPELGSLLFVRGRLADGRRVVEMRWDRQDAEVKPPLWDGTQWRGDAFIDRALTTEPAPGWLRAPGATFVAHSRALPGAWRPALRRNPAQRIWTSGTKSWFRLARDGIWVEGCAEQFGFEQLRPTLEHGPLGLPAFADWHVLTHGEAVDAWLGQDVTVTYEVRPKRPLDARHPAVRALARAGSAFWTSGSQFEAFRPWIPDGCRHACRYGRTWLHLRQQGLADLTVYPSVEAWREQAERCRN